MTTNNGNNNFNECLPFNYQNKENLISILNKYELHGKKTLIRNGWFNDNILDSFYDLLDWVDQNNNNNGQ